MGPAIRSVQGVQEACLNGWPALRELVFDGWLLRFSGGYTRRANSVHPLSPGMQPLDEKIQYCEALYAAQGLPTLFCIPSTARHRWPMRSTRGATNRRRMKPGSFT